MPGFSTRSIGEENIRLPRRKPKMPGLPLWMERVRQHIIVLIKRAWARLARRRTGAEWRMFVLKLFALIIAFLAVSFFILWITLPNIDDPSTMFPSQSTVILDRNGVELYRLFSEQDRTYVAGDLISDSVKKATIAIEDERFFDRGCFDAIGFVRAGLSQFFPSFLVRSGGSTLTQQFAKNALVGSNRSLVRKVRELMLACELERKYNKEQLLELYLNWIPFGSNAYGIEQASKAYFAVSAKDLTLAQSVALAGLLQRPSYFNPYGYHVHTAVSDRVLAGIRAGSITAAAQIADADIKIGLIGNKVGSGSTPVYIGGRTDQVLQNMVQQKMITEEDRNKALIDLQKMKFAPERQNIRAPHFVLAVEQQVQTLLGIDPNDAKAGEHILEQGGFRITTTLDWNVQQAAEKAVASHKDDVAKRFGAHNIALIALAPHTREILAYVGNADFGDDANQGKIDMAKAPRQPGSSFKPFTYLAAFEQGYGPGSAVYDVPTKFGSDTPQNFDGTFWGLISMRQALGGSRNIPAIKAFFLGGGEDPLLALASRMGVTTPATQKAEYTKTDPSFGYGWPLAIGAAEVPLTEMVQGYATIADDGMYRPMQSILKITDRDGNLRFLPENISPTQVIDGRYTAQITSVLSDVSVRPNEFWQSILSVPGYAAAAKTGTSNKCLERDNKNNCTLRRPESNWTMGFTPNLIAGVWVGNATSQSLFEKADGLTAAAPIWHDFMVSAHKSLKDTKVAFIEPPKMTHPLISHLSGQLASACTPANLQTTDLFLEENTPTIEDPACALLTVDKVTGLLASASCPADAAEEQAFLIPKSELPERWPLWEQGVQGWVTKQMEVWKSNPTHSGSLLPLPVAPTTECDASLTPGRFVKPELGITAPSEGESVSYPSFPVGVQITSLSKITKVQYFVDDKPLREETDLTGDYSHGRIFESNVRVPRTIESSGSHTVKVSITDEYFNTVSDEVSFSFGQ